MPRRSLTSSASTPRRRSVLGVLALEVKLLLGITRRKVVAVADGVVGRVVSEMLLKHGERGGRHGDASSLIVVRVGFVLGSRKLKGVVAHSASDDWNQGDPSSSNHRSNETASELERKVAVEVASHVLELVAHHGKADSRVVKSFVNLVEISRDVESKAFGHPESGLGHGEHGTRTSQVDSETDVLRLVLVVGLVVDPHAVSPSGPAGSAKPHVEVNAGAGHRPGVTSGVRSNAANVNRPGDLNREAHVAVASEEASRSRLVVRSRSRGA